MDDGRANLPAAAMPVRCEEGAQIRIFSGSSGGITEPTQNVVPVTMVEMTLERGARVAQDLPGDYTGFLYVLEGAGSFGLNAVEARAGQAMLLGSGEAGRPTEVTVNATEPLKALLYAGRPLREPVVAYGPFGMNTREEILEAIRDYQSGKFGE